MKRKQAHQKASVSQRDAAILYDRLAGVYDIWGHLTESKARNRALALANVKPGQHILEVAVGTGLAFVHVVRYNPDGRNVGIDISQGMLSKAEQRLRKAGLANYELSLGSALAIQEQACSFDVLLNNYMFDLLDEHEWTEALQRTQISRPAERCVKQSRSRGTGPCWQYRKDGRQPTQAPLSVFLR